MTTMASDEPLRRALLQRLANGFALLWWIDQNRSGFWSCCWVDYQDVSAPWGGWWNDHKLCDDTCAHRHHWHEAPTAFA
jgi:hypothetical protein